MRPYIYLVKNQYNIIVYIGQQIGTKSLLEYKGSGLLLNRAYKKYGEDKFTREILHLTTDYSLLCKLEEKEQVKRSVVTNPNYYNGRIN
jgi:hypothetical protein